MFLDPNSLQHDIVKIEATEKASTRFVAQALDLFRAEASEIFSDADDLQADIGEDITSEALDSLGMSRRLSASLERWITNERAISLNPNMLSGRYYWLIQKPKEPVALLGSKPLKLLCVFAKCVAAKQSMNPARFRLSPPSRVMPSLPLQYLSNMCTP